MPPSDLLRARLAPADPLEAVFASQAVLASEELASLASQRPDTPDARWLRHYAQAQNVFRKALADLEKLRKNPGAPAEANPPAPAPAPPAAEASEAASAEPASLSPAPAWPEPRNRRERRQLEALKRSARHRLQRAAAPPSG